MRNLNKKRSTFETQGLSLCHFKSAVNVSKRAICLKAEISASNVRVKVEFPGLLILNEDLGVIF